MIDPCDAPQSLVASTLTNQVYTITQDAIEFSFEAFSASPNWCKVSYSYSTDNSEIKAALTFDEAALAFKFYQDDDLSLAGQTYTIQVHAEAGNLAREQASGVILLEIREPCSNKDFIRIKSAPIASGLKYALYAPQMHIVHDAFTIEALKPETVALCGDLVYTVTFNGV